MNTQSGINSNLELGMIMGNSLSESGGIVGEVTLECFSADGDLRWTEVHRNKITDIGDQYYTTRAAAGVNSNGVAQPTLVAGMALGTTATAEAKNGAGSFITTYVTSSRTNLDAGKPTVATNVITYVVTFGPGVGTATLQEIALTTDTTNTGGTAGTTVSRAVISPSRVKASGDTLVATWTHTFLGA